MAPQSKEKQTVYYGTIENVDARTPLTDKTLIDKAYSDKQAEVKKEEEELIKEAGPKMSGALITYETTAKVLEELDEFMKTATQREKMLKKYYYDKIKTINQEALDTIQFFKTSKEVSPERRKIAMTIWQEYDKLTPAQKRRKYGEKYNIDTILGVKQAWEYSK